jgi:hypothetical protein
MTIIYNSAGQSIRKSRNLRGLMDHMRRQVPIAATLTDTDGRFLTEEQAGQPVRRYELAVAFDNGDTALCYWADWRVCKDWIKARRGMRGMRLLMPATMASQAA